MSSCRGVVIVVASARDMEHLILSYLQSGTTHASPEHATRGRAPFAAPWVYQDPSILALTISIYRNRSALSS